MALDAAAVGRGCQRRRAASRRLLAAVAMARGNQGSAALRPDYRGASAQSLAVKREAGRGKQTGQSGGEGWGKERATVECEGQAKTFLGASPENERHTTPSTVR
mgnify:CR=1 FL=1|tara:strand:+ start:20563 stop:20874 length:312 start_codon:yes stop_codon:yes gene_type:complete